MLRKCEDCGLRGGIERRLPVGRCKLMSRQSIAAVPERLIAGATTFYGGLRFVIGGERWPGGGLMMVAAQESLKTWMMPEKKRLSNDQVSPLDRRLD